MTPRKRTNPGPATTYTAGRILVLRRERGIQQAELAAALTALGWPATHHTVSDIELGNRRIGVEELCRIAAALGVAPGELLPEKSPYAEGPAAESNEPGGGNVQG